MTNWFKALFILCIAIDVTVNLNQFFLMRALRVIELRTELIELRVQTVQQTLDRD